ncbi:MAG: DNA-directed RNA polymerase subunit omega [Nitrospinota bacterium]
MENLEAELFAKVRDVIPGRFMMANVVSRRLEQLIRGAEPKFDPKEIKGMSKLEIALKEIAEGKITVLAKKEDGEEAAEAAE